MAYLYVSMASKVSTQLSNVRKPPTTLAVEAPEIKHPPAVPAADLICRFENLLPVVAPRLMAPIPSAAGEKFRVIVVPLNESPCQWMRPVWTIPPAVAR